MKRAILTLVLVVGLIAAVLFRHQLQANHERRVECDQAEASSVRSDMNLEEVERILGPVHVSGGRLVGTRAWYEVWRLETGRVLVAFEHNRVVKGMDGAPGDYFEDPPPSLVRMFTRVLGR